MTKSVTAMEKPGDFVALHGKDIFAHATFDVGSGRPRLEAEIAQRQLVPRSRRHFRLNVSVSEAVSTQLKRGVTHQRHCVRIWDDVGL